VGDEIRFIATVSNVGQLDLANIVVNHKIDGEIIETSFIPMLRVGDPPIEVEAFHTCNDTDLHTYCAEAIPMPGETNLSNNEQCVDFACEQPPMLTLNPPDPGRAGEINYFDVFNATPRARVHFVYGLRSGSTPVPNCPGLSVDMGSPEIFGIGTAGSGGDVTVEAIVPTAASGKTVRFQAVEADACVVSNLVVFTFP